MQRIVSLVMAIIVMAISCLPCSDADAMPCAEVVSLVSGDAGAGPTDDAHQEDFCSPLCSCSCCAAVTTPPHPFVLVFRSVAQPIEHRSDHLPVSLIETVLPIWQPPQLG